MESTIEAPPGRIADAKRVAGVADAPEQEAPPLLTLLPHEDAAGVCDLDGNCR